MNRTQLAARVAELKAAGPTMIPTDDDRAEMAVALVIQGFELDRAWRMAFDPDYHEWLKDNDGALQMLARHRLAQAGKADS